MSQRKILQEYAAKKGFASTKFCADDGVSGTTFDRPDFKRLLEDIEKGEIGAVIVKDLSRLGILNAMVSYYTDLYFPQNSIRFIAIFDDVDSESGDNEFAPFKNIFNEWYNPLSKTHSRNNLTEINNYVVNSYTWSLFDRI